MLENLKKIIGSIDADYADLRYEIKSVERVGISKKEIKGSGSNSGDGYVLRVLKNGGLATVAFTKPEQAEIAVKKALANAQILSSAQKEATRIAATPVIKETYRPVLEIDPRTISLPDKIEITRHYSDLLSARPFIANVELEYSDTIRNKYFVNSEGSEICEELVTTKLGGSVISQDGSLTQTVRMAFGGSDGFWRVQNREAEALDKARIAADLLKAVPVTAGNYKIILNPGMAGVFTHEAFGHFSEADIVRDLPSLRDKMQLGTKLGSDILTIIDDATMAKQLGFYKYDDDGVAVRRVNLMTNGVLTARLHNRFTAAEMNEPLTGHSIAEDFRYAPIVRMGNIFIQPGDKSFDELMQIMGDGLYLCEPMGGQTSGENFTFGANHGYLVKNGKISGMIRDINVVGNLYKTLAGISAVGSDFVLKEAGGCGKGQTNIRSCFGGPHVLVNELTVGGSAH